MESSLVSAIVLNFRTPQPAVECVFSLFRQSIGNKMEIFVVDNHSEDDSIGVLRNRLSMEDRVRIIESPRNGGFGFGSNFGVRYTNSAFILINNPDKRLEEDGVLKLVEKMRSDPSIGILAPQILHKDGTRRYSARSYPGPADVIIKRTFLRRFFKKHLARYLLLDEDPNQERDVDWVVGGCFMIRGDLFRSLNGFDDRYFLFFEDTDLCRRCHLQGKRIVYHPQVVAYDRKDRLSEGGVWKLMSTRIGRAHMASGIRYFRKWGIIGNRK